MHGLSQRTDGLQPSFRKCARSLSRVCHQRSRQLTTSRLHRGALAPARRWLILPCITCCERLYLSPQVLQRYSAPSFRAVRSHPNSSDSLTPRVDHLPLRRRVAASTRRFRTYMSPTDSLRPGHRCSARDSSMGTPPPGHFFPAGQLRIEESQNPSRVRACVFVLLFHLLKWKSWGARHRILVLHNLRYQHPVPAASLHHPALRKTKLALITAV